MKKLVTLFSFIAVLGLLLSACGGGATPAATSAPEQTEAPVITEVPATEEPAATEPPRNRPGL